jgi:hypothetical protein
MLCAAYGSRQGSAESLGGYGSGNPGSPGTVLAFTYSVCSATHGASSDASAAALSPACVSPTSRSSSTSSAGFAKREKMQRLWLCLRPTSPPRSGAEPARKRSERCRACARQCAYRSRLASTAAQSPTLVSPRLAFMTTRSAAALPKLSCSENVLPCAFSALVTSSSLRCNADCKQDRRDHRVRKEVQ